jgi:hypothetical protein
MPHFWFTSLLAIMLSCALAALGERSQRERIAAGVYTLLASLGSVFAGGWLMYLVHR